MAARLEWNRRWLMLGGWRLGEVEPSGASWTPVVTRWPALADERLTPREDEADARQDLESEVRRLLKKAGVEVDPLTKAMDEEGAWLGTVIAASDINVRSEAAARLSRRLADMHDHIADLETDNAALIDGVQCIRNLVAYPTLSERDTLSAVADVGVSLVIQPHPGAALLEGHRKTREALSGLLLRIRSTHVDMGGKHRYAITSGPATVKAMAAAEAIVSEMREKVEP